MTISNGNALTPCVCGCGVHHSRLNKRGHAWGCRGMKCGCVGRRSRSKGRDGQARMHKRLGGEGLRSSHEEAARPYPIAVAVESKVGGQVPANLRKALDSEWFTDALEQAREQIKDSGPLWVFKDVAVFTCRPSVYVEISRSRAYLIVALD